MNTISKTDFMIEVIKELNHIKKHATDEELSKLDIKSLNHESSQYCIYGLMTGFCMSNRALELYHKTFSIAAYKRHESFIVQDFEAGSNFTALEKYLYMVNDDVHKHIIDFLKGNINHLNLNL